MGMETYSIQVMELLSLGVTSDGKGRMKVAVTQDDRQSTHVIALDEFTYFELEALKPLSGGRIRLSPYSKWDPFRNAYYSSIVRTTDTSRDTLYFACSESYIHQIKQLRQLPPAPPEDSRMKPDCASEAANQTETAGRRRSRAWYVRLPKMAIPLLVLVGLMALLSNTSEGRGESVSLLGGGKADAADLNMPVAVPPLIHRLYEDGAAYAKAAVAARAPDDQPEGYKIIDISGSEKFFGLPEHYVALTFDDGPSPRTKQIVDILTEHQVVGTFLFVGKNAKRNPDAVIYASEQGMSVGNHSWDHRELTKVTLQDQQDELSDTNQVLESLTHQAVTLFRPPYGAVDDSLMSAAKKQNLKVLLWNRDPEDWNAKKPEDIIRYFHQVKASGGVYVLHEDNNTVKALPAIIQYLQDQHLTFVAFQ
ncbi:polysaccharide deacetylase family protein [Paenibacillus protaetiae]|nr:polysaccharide deacetylase family protein [Paenibacillus protaetiae]